MRRRRLPCEMECYDHTTKSWTPCGKPASYVIDPFIAEIYEETVRCWLCDECYEERRDDI